MQCITDLETFLFDGGIRRYSRNCDLAFSRAKKFGAVRKLHERILIKDSTSRIKKGATRLTRTVARPSTQSVIHQKRRPQNEDPVPPICVAANVLHECNAVR